MLFFHLSSDQWWQYKKCFWRLSLFLQNSIAPSFSRGRFAWRRRRINFFDTSNSESEYSPGSTSVQVLFPVGTVLGEDPAGSRLRGFALAFDRLAKSLAFNLNANSSNCISEVSCSLLFKFVTNLFEFSTHAFLSFCCMTELGDGFGCFIFLARVLMSGRKLQLSPLEHCPLASHCQQSPRILCSRCFVPWFLTTAFLS